ncbi:MAG: carboxypeptidase regulatory-like domain-containing protein [Saprospiraceae bacterium]|nr:carboxypeptidase regulatory-like domain-containing protein [Saprospiraceae bacterium]
MRFKLLINAVSIIFLISTMHNILVAQCSVNAGDDITICQGETAYLTVSDGVTPLPQGSSFLWSNGDTNYFTYVNPNSTTNYSVTMTTTGGCQAMDQITVIVGAKPTITLNGKTNTTCGNSDGSISVTASGSGSVNYIWSNGEAGSSITGLTSGTYKLTVVDDYGCTNTATYVVSVNGNTGVSGVVYGDFNYNAINDQIYQGYSGITVNLYGSDGDGNSYLYATTTTAADGTYEFPNVDFTNAQVYREEFVIPYAYYVTTEGDIENLQVRYISGPSCTEDLAISIPTDYCDTDNPLYTTVTFVNGDPLAGGTAGTRDAIETTNYLNTGFPGSQDYTPYTSEAIGSEVGSLWGVSYQRYSEIAFYSAYLKRHVGLGPGGLGAIYAVDYSSGTGAPVYEYLNLTTDFGINVGTVTDRDLPANWGSPSHDPDAYVKIGKVGIGDIDISDDGKTLYVTNLYSKTLVMINIGNPVVANPTLLGIIPIPNPGCGGDWRPFALKYYAGKLYVGGVCSGQAAGTTPVAYVYEYLPGVGFNNNPILTFPFDWTRAAGGGSQWGAWDDIWPSSGVSQPMLTDLEFEVDGAMILGVRNRSGDQYGFKNYSPNLDDTNLYSIFAPGDVLRADPNGDGTFTLENNGVSQGKTGCGADNGEGPGGGEFFCGDAYLSHTETATGGLAKFAGSGEAMSTVIDPFRAWSQGVVRFSVTDGSPLTAYEFFQTDVNSLDGFGKANGMGDIEVFCKPAPIEVGDYVWIDTNNNGIQDPGEEPIVGVSISIYDAAGTLVGQTTTDAHGYYYFTDLNFETQYYIVVDDSMGGFEYNGQNLVLTTPNVNGNQNDLIDSDATIKGFGVPNPVLGKASISFVTGLPGETNHSLDIGFYDCVLPVDAGQNVAICNGQCVILTSSTNGGYGQTTCTWDTGQTGCSIQVCPNETRTYIVTITDELGCKGTDDVTVTVEAQPVSDILATDFVCPGTQITFTALDAGANATYVWNFDGGVTADGDTNDRIEQVTFPNTLAETTRTVTLRVYSQGGCYSDYTHQIEIGSLVWADAQGDVSVCSGGCVEIGGTIQEIAVAGGTFVWSPSTYLSSTTISNPEVCLPTNINSKTYTLTVSKGGCTATDQVTVTKDPGLDPIADAGTDQLSCNGAPVVIGGNPTGSIPNGSTDVITGYLWSPSTGLNNITIANPTATTTVTRTYTVTVFTENGCTATDQVTVTADLCDDLSLGNFVWNDVNNNGIFDAGETPISGVKLILWKETNGDMIPDVNTGLTATTDANGFYIFENLTPGDYIVQVDPTNFNNGKVLEGYQTSTGNDPAPDPDNNVNNDDNGYFLTGYGIVSKAITLTLNGEPTNDGDTDSNTNLTVDFGFYARVSIGSTVFVDDNDNGIQDPGEAGIPDLTLQLLDDQGNVLETTMTDENGNYIFDNLVPGVYQVKIPTPDPSYPTSSTPTDTADNSQDNDDNGSQPNGTGGYVISPLITLTPGNETTNEPGSGGTQDDAMDANGDMTVDFGFIPAKMSIGSTVFIDTNDNGIYDNNEQPLPGITVELLDDAGNVIATDETDNNGDYYFGNLPEGNYYVRIPNPNTAYPTSSSVVDTNDDQIDNDNNGSQPDGSGGYVISPLIHLMAGTEPTNELGTGGAQDDANDANGDMTVDFGFIPELMSIGSTVFIDFEDDGIYNNNDTGIEGITVELLNSSGTVIATDDTDASGNYYFGNLVPGNYQVRISNVPTLYPTSSSITDTSDDSVDNDDNGIQSGGPGTPVISPIITLSPGTETTIEPGPGGTQDDANDTNGDMTIDFGFYPLVDINLIKTVNNSTPNVGDNVVFTITVDNNGPSVATGVVVNDQLPSGYQYVSSSPIGAYNSVTGDWTVGTVNVSTPKTLTITAKVLASGDYRNIANVTATDQPDVDSTPGNAPDTDGDGNIGSEDDGDPNDIEDPNDEDDADDAITTPVPLIDLNLTKVVDNSNPFLFDYVTFTINVNNVGPSTATGVQVQDVLPAGFQYISSSPAGAYDLGTGIWNVGTVDKGQTVSLNITVQVLEAFSPGDHLNIASISAADQQDVDSTPGNAPDTDGDGNIGSQDDGDPNDIEDPNDEDDADDAIVVVKPIGSIGSTVFLDTNNNGIMDSGETGIPGVTVQLLDDKGNVLQTKNTDALGNYYFDGLANGIYQVRIPNVPGAYPVSSTNTDISDNSQDNDDNGIQSGGPGTSIVSPLITITAGTETTNEPGIGGTQDDAHDTSGDMTIDFGLFAPASLGNYVWEDNNMNGIQDPTENPVAGITVSLVDNLGNPVRDIYGNIVTNKVTNGSGNYLFDNLLPGDYKVIFSNLPEGYIFSTPNTGDGTNDSDPDPNTGTTGVVTLVSGQYNPNVDAGIFNSILPVELLYFRGKHIAAEKLNRLDWATASEINTREFIVERSFDAVNFKNIGTVSANGNSNEELEYSFDDTGVIYGAVYYYRLKIMDYDGSFEYSDIISINLNTNEKITTSIYPNPFYDRVNITIITKGVNELQTVFVIDEIGRVVREFKQDMFIESGENYLKLDLNDLVPGAYTLSMKFVNRFENSRIIKL